MNKDGSKLFKVNNSSLFRELMIMTIRSHLKYQTNVNQHHIHIRVIMLNKIKLHIKYLKVYF